MIATHRPAPRATDRAVVTVVALVLVGLGLLAVDWRTGTVLALGPRLDLGGLRTAVDSAWWPWVAAVVGVLLVVIALRWVLALLPGRGPGRVRLGASDQRGTLELDLRSIGAAVSTRLEELGPLTGVRHTTAGSAAGGVAANRSLRQALRQLTEQQRIRLIVPPPALCTDNGAMIAWAGAERLAAGLTDTLDTAPRARWPLETVLAQRG